MNSHSQTLLRTLRLAATLTAGTAGMLMILLLGGCFLVNQPPVAIARVTPTSGTAPLAVDFDASQSYDPDSSAIRAWRWSFGDGQSDTGKQVTHTYMSAGTRTVRLTVEDGAGDTDTCTRTITIDAPPEPPEPVLAAIPFEKTADGFWRFVSHCQNRWQYEYDLEGELVQHPSTSYERMAGDCDDFATMIAGYGQVYWEYETFLGFLEMPCETVDHYVAFLRVADYATLEWYHSSCPGIWPYWNGAGGDLYLPIDMKRCPWWHWTNYGGCATMTWTGEWNAIVGLPKGSAGMTQARSSDQLEPDGFPGKCPTAQL